MNHECAVLDQLEEEGWAVVSQSHSSSNSPYRVTVARDEDGYVLTETTK
jgi:hypothetical protein